jgi:LemA protein
MMIFIPLIIIVLIIVYVASLYNNVVRKKNEVEKAFGSVDAMLKKRYDLIPNLVETVKQYSGYEERVLTEVTRLRAQLTEPLSSDEKIDLHNNLSKQLKGILFTVENYPDLKASKSFLNLQASWNEAEEQISAARRYYNSAVAEYNNSIQTFPANLFIDPSKFTSKKVFEIEVVERQNISAKELFKS